MEHLAGVHSKLSAVIVTTPQAVALMDVIKCLSFTRTVNLPVLGLVENMSGYACPCCGEVTNVFSTGGGAEMARREDIAFLGSLPVDTELVTLLDGGGRGEDEGPEGEFQLLERYSKTPSSKLFESIVSAVVAGTSV